jgi:hypothetical protein
MKNVALPLSRRLYPLRPSAKDILCAIPPASTSQSVLGGAFRSTKMRPLRQDAASARPPAMAATQLEPSRRQNLPTSVPSSFRAPRRVLSSRNLIACLCLDLQAQLIAGPQPRRGGPEHHISAVKLFPPRPLDRSEAPAGHFRAARSRTNPALANVVRGTVKSKPFKSRLVPSTSVLAARAPRYPDGFCFSNSARLATT